MPEASTIRRPRLDLRNLLLATTRATSCASIAAMVRRTTGWQIAVCTAGCPSSEAVRRQLSPNRADTRRHLDVLRREPRPRVAAKHRHEREPSLAGRHPSVVRQLARSLGRQHARGRRDQLQSENRFSGVARELAPASSAGRAPGQRPSNTRSWWKIRPCGRGHGPSSRSSPGRVTRRTEFITSRAASKEIMACRGCCMDGARKSAPLRRDEVPIREPRTTSVAVLSVQQDPLQ